MHFTKTIETNENNGEFCPKFWHSSIFPEFFLSVSFKKPNNWNGHCIKNLWRYKYQKFLTKRLDYMNSSKTDILRIYRDPYNMYPSPRKEIFYAYKNICSWIFLVIYMVGWNQASFTIFLLSNCMKYLCKFQFLNSEAVSIIHCVRL